MKRENGYIDLDALLKLPSADEFETLAKLYERVSKNEDIKPKLIKVNHQQLVFSFIYEKEEYYFKYDSRVYSYNELILEELAKDMGIPCISYDLAKLGIYHGVISLNYKKENANYISGQKILEDFYNKPDPNPIDIKEELFDVIHKKAVVQKPAIYKNTLEGIWAALEDRYKARENKEEIVSNLMNKLVQVFVFDALVGQLDRNCNNWEVIEFSNSDVDLQPLYDNSRALMVHPLLANLFMTVDDFDNSNLEEAIETFLKISSDEFKNLFSDNFWIISIDNILSVFNRVESKTGSPIPENLKEEYLEKFLIYRKFFEDKFRFKI